MTLELRYAMSRPSPKQLGLVDAQFESVGRHPLTDVGDAHLQLSRCGSDVCTKAVQIQLCIVSERLHRDIVAVDNVRKIGNKE